MFDAGAIMAHLDVETSLFNRKMDAAEQRVKRFETEKHEIRIGAVFDTASMGRARQMFTQLDQQLSRDAMARLRSSPQGSVLGALNALFSPHPVTGAPSPQQAASSGLLGRIVQAPGGGLPGGGGNGISNLLLGQAAGRAAGPGGTTRVTIDNLAGLANAVNGPSTPNVTPPDPNAASNASNSRNILQAAQAANAAAQNSSKAAQAANSAAQTSANSNRSLLSRIGGIFGGGGGGGGSGSFLGSFFGARGGGGGLAALIPGGSPGGFASGTAAGIGPGILGLGAKTTGIVGLGGSLLGALPALFGGLSPLIPGLAGAGALFAAFKGASSSVSPLTQLSSQIQNQQIAGLGATTKGQQQLANEQAQLAQGVAALNPAQQQMFTAIQNLQNWWQNFTAGMTPAFAKALTQISDILTQGPLSNAIQNFFTQSTVLIQPFLGGLSDIALKILPGLTQGFALAAPEIRPLLDGLGSLVGNMLPGLNVLIKAAMPAVLALAQIFGTLGSDIGQMFAIFAPVLTQSSVILKALFDIVSALFPIIGKLAAIFAQALAPVFLQFAGVVKALLPFLTTIGKVLAALAGAVLMDLVAAFGALAQLLVGISPALNAFATAFSQVFQVLENSGVFAIIGNALESLVGPLTVMINALLHGLTPLLPPIINFIGQLAGLLAAGLGKAIAALLPPLTQLALVVLQALAQVLPIILPLFITLTGILTAVFVRVVQDLATALSWIISKIPASALRDIALGFIAIQVAIEAVGLVMAASNPFVLIITAIALLVVGIVELATHWHEVWTNIKNWTDDAWHFLNNIFHNGIVQDILAVWSVGLIPLAEHWTTVWTNIKNWTVDTWHAIYNNVFAPLISWFTQSLPHGLDTAFTHVSGWWTDVKNAFNDGWNWIYAHTISPLSHFFTVDLPNWADTGVRALGTAWNKIKSVISAPIHWVAHNVLIPLFSGIDDITNFVGLNNPLSGAIGFLQGLARGGFVKGRSGPGADDQLAMLGSDELVVPAHLVHAGFVNHLRGLIPGFASGGFINPIGLNLTPERIDMGVDYGGAGALYALGSGVITSLFNSGWPGGGFIGLHLDQAPIPNGQYWYYAEDVNPYGIGVGSRVTKGQYIAGATGGPSGIEVGFAAPPGTGDTMASATGEANRGRAQGDPGAFPTGWGVAASNLIASLGGHPGILGGGGVQGGVPGIPGGFAGIIRTVQQIFSSLGHFASIAIDLASGNIGGAVGALLSIIKPGADGAGGAFAKMLLKLPVTLATDAVGGIVNAIKNFVAGQQSTGGSIGPVSGPADAGPGQAQNYARSRLGNYGWDINQFLPLQALWNKESSWLRLAINPTSGAYGIPQALPASKLPFAGQAAGGSHASPQIDWGLNYIKGTYGSPAGAWGHEVAFNWYKNGGPIREPVIGFGTRTGQGYGFAENGTEWVSRTPPGAGAMIGHVSIQLPDGQSVASALRELNFWLNVAKQQGWQAAVPNG